MAPRSSPGRSGAAPSISVLLFFQSPGRSSSDPAGAKARLLLRGIRLAPWRPRCGGSPILAPERDALGLDSECEVRGAVSGEHAAGNGRPGIFLRSEPGVSPTPPVARNSNAGLGGGERGFFSARPISHSRHIRAPFPCAPSLKEAPNQPCRGLALSWAPPELPCPLSPLSRNQETEDVLQSRLPFPRPLWMKGVSLQGPQEQRTSER